MNFRNWGEIFAEWKLWLEQCLESQVENLSMEENLPMLQKMKISSAIEIFSIRSRFFSRLSDI